ncbi:unnamed protein product, partial [Rotaria sordida]
NAWKRSVSTKERQISSEDEQSRSSQHSSVSAAKDIAPDKSSMVLILIDVINHLDFEGNEELIKVIKPIGQRIAELRQAARIANIPTIFVNDNFHKWKSDFRFVVENVLKENKPGKHSLLWFTGKILAELLRPDENDYFVLKPKHSGFYCTPLELLLDHLQARTLILTGFAGNICVLFTANDAYMRNYNLIVPRDCIGSNTPAENDVSLEQINKLLKADIRPSADIIKDIKNSMFNKCSNSEHSVGKSKSKQ